MVAPGLLVRAWFDLGAPIGYDSPPVHAHGYRKDIYHREIPSLPSDVPARILLPADAGVSIMFREHFFIVSM